VSNVATCAVKIARQYIVEGRVQGVGFRWFVERVAVSLKLAGYVRNLPSGDVEVYAIGDPRALDELRRELKQGPPGARVTGVRESPAPVQEHRSFGIAF
jgi:acylphosphatase